MGSISKKNIKVNKNLYFNLVTRRGENAPRITLDVNEWRALFAILEIFRTNKYIVDSAGYIFFDFKEYNRLFLAGRKGISSNKAAETLEALKERSFNLIFRDKKTKPETLEGRCLFDYEGDIREAKKIRLQKVFYCNIDRDYFNLPIDFISKLALAVYNIDGGRLSVPDLIVNLYAACYNAEFKPRVSKPLSELAAGIGLECALNARQHNRVITSIERALEVACIVGFLKGYSLKAELITMFFACAADGAAKRNKNDSNENNNDTYIASA